MPHFYPFVSICLKITKLDLKRTKCTFPRSSGQKLALDLHMGGWHTHTNKQMKYEAITFLPVLSFLYRKGPGGKHHTLPPCAPSQPLPLPLDRAPYCEGRTPPHFSPPVVRWQAHLLLTPLPHTIYDEVRLSMLLWVSTPSYLEGWGRCSPGVPGVPGQHRKILPPKVNK